ncbi:hypothetical protein HNR46_003184 [Haloferula luteola]|uniref:Uncharacterized protein n=1 Tax=Haloferula luteola TaxID=595692 RepID=A0A840V4J0_9BACT|nr:hypothetical protein [Haloferula luteola]MBB5352935.1 hypothetical protein [Haloferula luteola]
MKNLVLTLVAQSSRPLGSRAAIEAVVSRIAAVQGLTPKKFGFSEPLKLVWNSEWLDKLAPLYRQGGDIAFFRFSGAVSGSMTINTKSGSTAQLNEIKCSFEYSSVHDRLAEMEDLLRDLVVLTKADFAAITLGGGNPFSVDVANPENNVGEIGGHKVPQANPTGIRFLNSVWWINVFGPSYVDFFGRTALEGLSGYRSEFIAPGYFWLQPTAGPEEMWAFSGREAVERIKSELGRPKAFYGYEKGKPAFMLAYETPSFDLTELQTIPTA